MKRNPNKSTFPVFNFIIIILQSTREHMYVRTGRSCKSNAVIAHAGRMNMCMCVYVLRISDCGL